MSERTIKLPGALKVTLVSVMGNIGACLAIALAALWAHLLHADALFAALTTAMAISITILALTIVVFLVRLFLWVKEDGK